MKEDCIENFEAAVRGDWYAARRKSPNREGFDDGVQESHQYSPALGSNNSHPPVTPDVASESIGGPARDINDVTPKTEQNMKIEPSEEDASAVKGSNSSGEFLQGGPQRADQGEQNDSSEQDFERDTGSINGDNNGDQRDIPRSAFERMPPNQGGLSRNLEVLKVCMKDFDSSANWRQSELLNLLYSFLGDPS